MTDASHEARTTNSGSLFPAATWIPSIRPTAVRPTASRRKAPRASRSTRRPASVSRRRSFAATLVPAASRCFRRMRRSCSRSIARSCRRLPAASSAACPVTSCVRISSPPAWRALGRDSQARRLGGRRLRVVRPRPRPRRHPRRAALARLALAPCPRRRGSDAVRASRPTSSTSTTCASPNKRAALRPRRTANRKSTQRDERAALVRAVEQLPERERFIVSEHYFGDVKFKTLSEALGVSEPRVSQLHSRAMKRLREIVAADAAV